MQRNDNVILALGPGQYNDLLLAYYLDNGAETPALQDAEYEFLVAQGSTPAAIPDMWYEFLLSFGYTGSLSDMLADFWFNMATYYFITNDDWQNLIDGQDLTTELEAGRVNDVSGEELAENQANLGPDGTLNVGPGAYEQKIKKSEDISVSPWISTDVSITGVDGFTATAQFGRTRQNVTTVDSVIYTVSFMASIKNGGTLTGYQILHSDSASGNQTIITLTEQLEPYSTTVLGKTGGGNVTFGFQDNNGSDWDLATITDFQVTASTYRLPYAPNDSAVSTRLVPLNNGNATDGNWYEIKDDLLDAFDGDKDGTTLNSGNLVAIEKYEVITTETDHFGAGVVAGDRVTGLTTALDANNTVQTLLTAQATMVIPAWTPQFDYSIIPAGSYNIISQNGTVTSILYFNNSERFRMYDGITIAETPVILYQAYIPLQITAKWGPHPGFANAPKMMVSVTDGETTWDSSVVDFAKRFPVGDFMKFGFDNDFWQKFGTKPYILKGNPWS